MIDRLPPRLRQIAQTLATDPSPYKLLAPALGISQDTFKAYAHQCYKELNVGGREELIIKYWKERLDAARGENNDRCACCWSF